MAEVLVAVSTLLIVVGSFFSKTSLGYGRWLMVTLPGSPVIFDVLYGIFSLAFRRRARGREA